MEAADDVVEPLAEQEAFTVLGWRLVALPLGACTGR